VNTPLYAIFLYGKNEQTDLNSAQKKEVKAFAATIKAGARSKRTGDEAQERNKRIY
jgi:hypothetical protein